MTPTLVSAFSDSGADSRQDAEEFPRSEAAKRIEDRVFDERGGAPAGVADKDNSDPLAAMAEVFACSTLTASDSFFRGRCEYIPVRCGGDIPVADAPGKRSVRRSLPPRERIRSAWTVPTPLFVSAIE